MQKKQFFIELHEKLAVKYRISPGIIGTIRSFAIGRKMTREEIMDWADEKDLAAKKNGFTPKKQWIDMFNFLEDLQDDAFEEITKRTKYDVKKI